MSCLQLLNQAPFFCPERCGEGVLSVASTQLHSSCWLPDIQGRTHGAIVRGGNKVPLHKDERGHPALVPH